MEFSAQRSTRRYCGEACKQRAKRARERAAQWDHLPPEARCQWCGGLLFPDKSERDNERLALYALGNPRRAHARKYCSCGCRNAARRFRYRVAHMSEESAYRVTDPVPDPYALTEPAPCWRSAQWHEQARFVLTAMKIGWVLAPAPDQEHIGEIDLALVRDFAASKHSGPSPGDGRADRELSLREQDPASPDAAPDSGLVQDSALPAAPDAHTAWQPAGHSGQADASDSWGDLWEKMLHGPL